MGPDRARWVVAGVWSYSTKRAARDAKTLTLQENRAKAVVAGEKCCPHPAGRDCQERLTNLDDACPQRLASQGALLGKRQGVRHEHPRDVDARR